MLKFIIQKVWSKKWMFLGLLLGNLMMIAVAAVGPMYSDAALQRTLTRTFSDYYTQTNQHPGTIIMRASFNGFKRVSYKGNEQAAEVFGQMLEEWKVPVIYHVEQYYKVNLKAVHEIRIDNESNQFNLKLTSYTDLEEHIEMVNGEMYADKLDGDTIEVIVSENTFISKRLMLGQELELSNLENTAGEPYRLRIAGVFKNSKEQDSYWLSAPNSWSNVFVMDPALFQELFVMEGEEVKNVTVERYAVLDYTAMQRENASDYLNMVDKYQETLESIGVQALNVYSKEVLEDFLPVEQKVTTTIWILLIPIFALLVTFVFMVSQQMLEMEQNEIAIYKSRGAGKGQIVLLYLLQAIGIAAISFAGGIPLGVFMCKVMGASNSFLEFVKRAALPIEIDERVLLVSAAAALFSVLTMVLPVFRYADVNIVMHKRKKTRSNKRPLWKTLFLDIILIGISCYGLYQYNEQKEYLAQKVMDGAALDPILYICSSLFMVGAGLFVLRVFPWVIKLIFRMGRRWWSPALYTSFLRILRIGGNQGFLMVFLILTVSMGIYNAQSARSINTNAEEKMKYMIGADIVLQEVWQSFDQNAYAQDGELEGADSQITYIEPDFDSYQELEGAESVTKVLVDKKAIISVEGGKLNNTMLMGIHTKQFGETAWFKEDLLPLHYHEYLNAMAGDSQAILVSSNLQKLYGYELGDVLNYSTGQGHSMKGVIYGFVDYWPAYAPITVTKGSDGLYSETENFLIVAHLARLQTSCGVTPYQVWIKTKDSSGFIYDHMESSGVNYAVFEDAAAQLIEMKNDPVFQGTNGILTIGFICILTLCSIGFLIYWILSIRSRTLQFGIFRAMGMTMREIFMMLINEQIFITGISIGAGILIGRLTSRLFIPLIQLAYSSADQVLPLEIVSVESDYVKLFVVIGTVILICMAVLGGLIARIKISQALKLGED